MKILILGASGMLGNAVFRYFSTINNYEVVGTARSIINGLELPSNSSSRIAYGINAENNDSLVDLFQKERPNVVVNCVGLIKQLAESEDPILAMPINSLLPHRLAKLCKLINARFIHISTDCVFSGKTGMYTELEFADANDLYGRTKFLGEVDYSNAITLRTSIIGHELHSSKGLIDWFLKQNDTVKGFSRAVFSGLPTVEIARVIHRHVLPNSGLHGIYHVSAEPINKYDLLKLVAITYGKKITIDSDESLIIDRSLDSTKFRMATGFKPLTWPELVKIMHDFH